MNNVTLNGNKLLSTRYNHSFYDPGRDTEVLYSFQVPDDLFRGGVPSREMGFESERTCRLSGLYLRGDKTWAYAYFYDNGGRAEGRSALLDRLFAPVLPAVSVQVTDYM